MTIQNLTISENRLAVEWHCNGEVVRKAYAGSVDVLPLADGERVLILEPFGESASNAVIFDSEGTEQTRIPNPFAHRGALGFSAAGYEGNELTLISRLRGLEIACVYNEDGNLLRTSEIR